MTSTNLMGPSLSLGRIERALTAHVRAWHRTYLREAELAEGFGPSGQPHPVGALPVFRSYRATEGRVDRWPEDQLPACLFGSPGLAERPTRTASGDWRGEWAFGFTAVVSGRDDATTRWLAGVYVASLRLLFVQQPAVPGLPIESMTLEDEAYDVLPFRRSRSLMAGTVTFSVGLSGLASARGGPAAPLPEPEIDPGPFPTVTDTDVTIERRPLA